jgi:hypothetical protein
VGNEDFQCTENKCSLLKEIYRGSTESGRRWRFQDIADFIMDYPVFVGKSNRRRER